MRLERSVVRRNAERPELAEGDRTLVELDPDAVRRMLAAGASFVGELNRLLKRPAKRPPHQRRRKRARPMLKRPPQRRPRRR